MIYRILIEQFGVGIQGIWTWLFDNTSSLRSTAIRKILPDLASYHCALFPKLKIPITKNRTEPSVKTGAFQYSLLVLNVGFYKGSLCRTNKSIYKNIFSCFFSREKKFDPLLGNLYILYRTYLNFYLNFRLWFIWKQVHCMNDYFY